MGVAPDLLMGLVLAFMPLSTVRSETLLNLGGAAVLLCAGGWRWPERASPVLWLCRGAHALV